MHCGLVNGMFRNDNVARRSSSTITLREIFNTSGRSTFQTEREHKDYIPAARTLGPTWARHISRCHKCHHTYWPSDCRSFNHPISTAGALADPRSLQRNGRQQPYIQYVPRVQGLSNVLRATIACSPICLGIVCHSDTLIIWPVG
jgi:hypothetical protein